MRERLIFIKPSFYLWQAKRGSILMVSLWILVILTLLAVGIGWRISRELRLVRNQRDRVKARYLAKAAISRATLEIDNDRTPNCDSLKDSWADNEEVFKEIRLGEKDDFATVSYRFKDEDTREEETIYGVIDEERKININRATKSILSSLPEMTEELADNICAWRGDKDVPETAKDYRDLGYPCKNKQFTNVEELLLVKGMTLEIYSRIKDLVTLWGQGVNINTASKEVVQILIDASVKELTVRNVPERDPGDLLDKIMRYRKEGNFFEDKNLENYLGGLSSAQINIINLLKDDISVDSNFFRITACGQILTSKLKLKISCVWDSNTKKFLYWNES